MGTLTILPSVRVVFEPPNAELPEDTRHRGEYHAAPAESFDDVGSPSLVPKIFQAGLPLCGQKVEPAPVPASDDDLPAIVTCRWCLFHIRRLRLRVNYSTEGE